MDQYNTTSMNEETKSFPFHNNRNNGGTAFEWEMGGRNVDVSFFQMGKGEKDQYFPVKVVTNSMAPGGGVGEMRPAPQIVTPPLPTLHGYAYTISNGMNGNKAMHQHHHGNGVMVNNGNNGNGGGSGGGGGNSNSTVGSGKNVYSLNGIPSSNEFKEGFYSRSPNNSIIFNVPAPDLSINTPLPPQIPLPLPLPGLPLQHANGMNGHGHVGVGGGHVPPTLTVQTKGHSSSNSHMSSLLSGGGGHHQYQQEDSDFEQGLNTSSHSTNSMSNVPHGGGGGGGDGSHVIARGNGGHAATSEGNSTNANSNGNNSNNGLRTRVNSNGNVAAMNNTSTTSSSSSSSSSTTTTTTSNTSVASFSGIPHNIAHSTRHARRIYVGGIPPSYADEEMLTTFLNNVIAKGLGESSEHCYVLSMYINHKKCFAFVELSSIELTSACLELDGIVYRNSVLKILRANEYKPELVSPSLQPLKLNLPTSYFTSSLALQQQLQQQQSSLTASAGGENAWMQMDSAIKQVAASAVERGSLAIVGFPYDEGSRRSGTRQGCASAPKLLRQLLRKGGFGSLHNPEFGVDISKVQMFDVGDIPAGLVLEEAHSRLTSVVAELLSKGAVPIIVGGSNDQCYYSIAGLMSVAGGNIGVVNVNSQLGVRPHHHNPEGKVASGCGFRILLEDPRFCPWYGINALPSCDNRFVNFGAQGALCTSEQAQYITDRGGRIMWLTKDIRNDSTTSLPSSTPPTDDDIIPAVSTLISMSPCVKKFVRTVKELGFNSATGSRRPVCVSIDMQAMSSVEFPGVSLPVTMGLSLKETLDICTAAGADKNVVLLDLCEFNSDIEEARSGRSLLSMLYQFVLGFAQRAPQTNSPPQSTAPTPSLSSSPPLTIPSETPTSPMPNQESQSFYMQQFQQQQQQQQQQQHLNLTDFSHASGGLMR